MPLFCEFLFAQSLNFSETKKRAEAGNAEAQNDLGFKYLIGAGVPQSDAEALKWYRKAAEQGYASAQHSLGDMYERGSGVPKDDVEAYAWYNLSVVGRTHTSAFSIDLELKRQEFVGQCRARLRLKLTPEQIARAQKRSTELFNEIEARKKKAGK